MESVTCLRCRSATPPVLMHQDRRVAPPSILDGPTPSGPGLCGLCSRPLILCRYSACTSLIGPGPGSM
jgi:hypothetical protein